MRLKDTDEPLGGPAVKLGALGVETEVIKQMGKLHVNDWQVACGVSVLYKLPLKPVHHTTRVYKSLAMLKTTVLFPTGLLTTWSLHTPRESPWGPLMPCLHHLQAWTLPPQPGLCVPRLPSKQDRVRAGG